MIKNSLLKMIMVLLLFLAFKTKAQTLTVKDTRSLVSKPNDYNQLLDANFKYGSSINLSEVNPNFYYTTLGIRGWNDNSGGKAHELAFSNDGKIFFRSGYTEGWEGWRKLIITDESGNVGIGTDTPLEKLAVNGKIRAQEVKVESANWPDYVFEDDYKVESLENLENYIKTNKHLPEMPSAKSVAKYGLAVGEILKLQQKKIEELTLHLIEKDKEINDLKKLNSRISELELKIEKLIKK